MKKDNKISTGKTIHGVLYIHKSAIDTLTPEQFTLYKEKLEYINDFDFTIIKIDSKNSAVSFIYSPDWDVASEPTVGDSILVKHDNSVKYIKSKGLIYHHKWMFVKRDYTGFDVTESMMWSEFWLNHPYTLRMKADVHSNFNSKIGWKSYWDTLPFNIKSN